MLFRSYNAAHGITPKTIVKAILDLDEFQSEAKREGLKLMRDAANARPLSAKNAPYLVETLERQMRDAADSLDFELAALLRDQLFELREMTGLRSPTPGGQPAPRRRKKQPPKSLKRAVKRVSKRQIGRAHV